MSEAVFFSQNTVFADNIRAHKSEITKKPLFDICWGDGEYQVGCCPKNYQELKEICEILCMYSKDLDDLRTLTSDFLEDSEIEEYFDEFMGEDERYEMLENALDYCKEIFKNRT